MCETTLADDYTARYGAEGKANVGRDHYVRVCKMLRKSFPDVAITIEDLVVEGDKIVNRYIERGTLTGRTFLGIEPAGQRYEKPGTTSTASPTAASPSRGASRTRSAGSASSASTPTERYGQTTGHERRDKQRAPLPRERCC